jgi:hypothetical protein
MVVFEQYTGAIPSFLREGQASGLLVNFLEAATACAEG